MPVLWPSAKGLAPDVVAAAVYLHHSRERGFFTVYPGRICGHSRFNLSIMEGDR